MLVVREPASPAPNIRKATAALLATALAALANARKKLIIDTDIFSAVDDVGALAIANVFHNAGDAEIVGVMVNTPSKWGPLAVSVRPLSKHFPVLGPKLFWRLLTPTMETAKYP